MRRRAFLLAGLAPAARPAYVGKVLAASYDRRLRVTTIYFETPAGTYSGRFFHDSSEVDIPVESGRPVLAPVQPKIEVRREGLWLNSYSRVRKLTTLMPVGAGSELTIVYPERGHPDVTAVWSVDGRLFFTNNDYHNVYELPSQMESPRMRVPKWRNHNAGIVK